jgi:hypothetical protein
MKKNRPAVVYFLTNEAFEGKCVKIGRTLNLKARIKELSKTGLPFPFRALRIVECLESEYCELESRFHHIFREARINEDREFFKIDVDEIDNVLEDMAELKVYCSEAEYDAAQVGAKLKERVFAIELWWVINENNQNKLFAKMDTSSLTEDSAAYKEMIEALNGVERVMNKYGQKVGKRPIAGARDR